ncbi:DHH family phosphoesterase [Sediminispirochaeta bajacaliforniensis]|uniref:DHH family phosphoesterase n=1 Tax=Sediminispirochaeta bajacaliforniensis TaxID=148 RepID=UPI00035FF0DF|nr:bifunctional oligoribonuclease/PAP phosphatase NrnA [Sediminispirochaeta bajacaliforniensis]
MGRFAKVAGFIERHEAFFISGHETPDADALGSEIALYRALRHLGKRVKIVNADPAAQKYDYLDPEGVIDILDPDPAVVYPLPEDVASWGHFILDTNDIGNIGHVASHILPYVGEYYIIDHHELGDDLFTDNHIEENASSTSEILYGLLTELNIPINLEVAVALYTGIMYDTGSFIYPKTSARTFGIAHDLVAIGVNPNEMYQHIYESNSIPALKLQSKVLASLELYYDQHVAVQTMLRETIAACGARYEEADSFINVPLKSKDIRVSIFFKENEQGILRCSLRSKGNINVAAIAQTFGGGGHRTAAGFKSAFRLETIKTKVLGMLQSYFESGSE